VRKYISVPVIVVLWVVVHLDWHLARSHHHRLSMEWHQHWILGLVAFVVLVLFSARRWPDGFVWATLLNGALGLFVGHIGEAWLEALKDHQPLAIPAERWHAFYEFSLPGLAGFLLGTVMVYGWRRWRGVSGPQTS
jgi:hypothetical protein